MVLIHQSLITGNHLSAQEKHWKLLKT